MRRYEITDLEARLTPSPKMPVLFVGHGSPMNAIADNGFTREWARVGSELPAAQAIVVISAHWLTPGRTLITDAPKNRVIHDFYGFPDELFRVDYPTRGDHEVATLLARHLVEYEAALDRQWGLDHGTWSVLTHLAPHPEVPVLQISVDFAMDLDTLRDQFSRLAPLRERGVLFLGSGNVVHSLQRIKWHGGQAWDWATEFDAQTADAMADQDIARLVDPYGQWAAARLAVPTDDHYRPMIAAMSLLSPGEQLSFFNTDIDLGSIGMRSFIAA